MKYLFNVRGQILMSLKNSFSLKKMPIILDYKQSNLTYSLVFINVVIVLFETWIQQEKFSM